MKRFALSFFLTLPMLAACGGSDTREGQITPGGPTVEYPEWVNRGSGAFGGDEQVLYGVGSAVGIKNHSLARSTADNRARAELGKIFGTYTASLMKDFQESVTAGDFSASSEGQMVSQAIKTFSQVELSGVEIVEHWIHPVDGSYFALARLDMEKFNNYLDKHQELNAKTKEAVKRAAEKAFADLEREEAKRSQ